MVVPKWKWAVIYAALGAFTLLWTAGPFVGYFAYQALERSDANVSYHARQELHAALATSDKQLVAEAEKTLGASAQQQGLTVLGQTVDSVKHTDAKTTEVEITVKTAEVGPVKLRVTFSKGLWKISNVAQITS